MSAPHVFRSEPLLVPKVWGGRKLSALFGKSLPDHAPYGESWEVADLPEGQSLVATGEHAGKRLGELVDRFGSDLVGTAAPHGRFPLLVKLLDAAADLSVQVHPGPEHLSSHPHSQSKDECWVVLHADDGASIVHGLTRTSTAEELRTAAESGELSQLLHRVPVTPGDVFRVPPGTIHAICAGVALLEIQQPSDTTYRVYDYGRLGLDGQPRELHVAEALDVAALGPTLPEDRGLDRSSGPVAPGTQIIANVDAYRIESIAPTAPLSWAVSKHSAQVVHVLRGELCLDEVLLGPSQTAVIPAAIGRVWLTRPQSCEIIVAGLGGPPLISL